MLQQLKKLVLLSLAVRKVNKILTEKLQELRLNGYSLS